MHRKHEQCACGVWHRQSATGKCAACFETPNRGRRTADELRALGKAAAPVLPTGPETERLSMPVRPWARGRADAAWLGVASWPDQVRRGVSSVDVSPVQARPNNERLYAGGGR